MGATEQELSGATPTRRVAVVYHYWAHYREAVMRELNDDSLVDYEFYGDVRDNVDRGIPPANTAGLSFNQLPCVNLPLGLMWQRGLIRLVAEGRHDMYILLGDVHYLSTWLALGAGLILRRRVWLWTIGWTRPDRGVQALVRRSFYRLARGLFLYGFYAKNYAIQNGFEPGKLQVVNNSIGIDASVDVPGMGDCSVVWSSASRGARLLVVSRLNARRGIADAIRAVSRLRVTDPNIQLVVVGTGPEEGRLRHLAAELSAPVVFFGPCYEGAVLRSLYESADCVVSPGAVGLLAISSLSMGVPVVTHDDWTRQAPEFEAVVDGVTGATFAEGSNGGLEDAIRRCLRLAQEPGIRQRCREFAQVRYSATFQHGAINWIVKGREADDLWFVQVEEG